MHLCVRGAWQAPAACCMGESDQLYDDAERESTRLFRHRDGRLEHLRSLELLTRLLPPPPGRVLDVGGGPGTYAAWLTEKGYETHLVDPSSALIVAASARAATLRIPFEVSSGDARQLDQPDESFDVVLLASRLELARSLEAEPSVQGASAHLLAAGKRVG